MIKPAFTKYFFTPLYEKFYKKEDTPKHFKKFSEMQWLPKVEVIKYQEKQLYNLLRFAVQKVPYYKRIADQKNIEISQDNIVEILQKFPILDKEIMRKNFKELQSQPGEERRYKNTSGGSTGEPVMFIQDSRYHGQSQAMTDIQFAWAEYEHGQTMIKLWGSEKDIFQEKEHSKHRFANWARGVHTLNSYTLDEEKIKEYIEVINEKKPKLILAYAQSINEIAKYILKHKMNVYSPKSIITSAGILYPEFRKSIEKAFKTKVFNRYGSREVGNIASECEKHEGLHVSSFTHFVEILDNKGKPCNDGQKGHIYITLLTNFSMPLIRYKIGDMAVPSSKPCSCGRGLPILKEVIGRDSDQFITKKGGFVDGLFFNIPIWKRDWIVTYQVIQDSPELITYKMVVRKNPPQIDLDDITNQVQKVMGKTCVVKFKIVEHIKPTKSGKFRYLMRNF